MEDAKAEGAKGEDRSARVLAELEAARRETADLRRELEGFSYSVSHDLRAPLRAIEGYARMLDQECGARLGEDGARLLGVVRASAARMGRMIEDLLELSRLGQRVPAKKRLDMTTLARQAAAALQPQDSRATLEVDTLPEALADGALMKQVWTILLGNALKFSATREAPRIQVSGGVEGAWLVYAVQDNGVGFDMRHAAKLFGVFQRLHRQEEFPGTGAGLAIAQRILALHAGRTGADARPDAGARFWFSLPAG
jgi:light-regulated signal transduction histidine kinase (bacteriophytochrome)